MNRYIYTLLCLVILNFNCGIHQENSSKEDDAITNDGTFKILALGDSYTIGESVCETCRFPEQLKDSLILNFKPKSDFELKIIAKTGWTTTNLINAITTENPDTNYDLVTLLIGVNNEYQGKPFSIYENEFPQLVNTAITKAKGIKNKIIVVSIPDYAFTPFGKGNTKITENIDKYNGFAESYCNANNITFVNITDITRMGLDNPELVASDGLHPSKLAYSKFVERLLPISIKKLE
jgi:acyl-CoA thioesterase I